MFWRLRFGIGFLPVLLASAAGPKLDEYQVKAAFICNFANFVEWPSATFKAQGDPFSVCVLGRNPFGTALQSLAEGRAVNGRSFLVRELADAREASGCQILFVSSSERLRYRSILESLKNSNVLSVGDSKDFIADGGVINLPLENGKVRVEINPQAARERNLRISSHLLGLAKNSR